MSCTHKSNRLAVDKPERHEPLPHEVPREVRHARCCDDADDVRARGGDEPGWRAVGSTPYRMARRGRTVLEVEGDYTAHDECNDLRDVADALEHGGLGRWEMFR